MRDPDARVRRVACSIVVRTAPDAAELARGTLLGAISDGDALVRGTAVGQLEQFVSRYGSPGENGAHDSALRALSAALGDPSPQVRDAAGWALFNLGSKAASTFGELDRAMDGADKSLRVIAAEALMRIDPTVARPRVIAAMRRAAHRSIDPA